MVEELARGTGSEGNRNGPEEGAGDGAETRDASVQVSGGNSNSGGVSTAVSPGFDSSPVLRAAIGYALRGWRVFPVKGKLPLVMWQDEATTDEDHIRVWWEQQFPEAGVAIVTGSGLVVLDVDAKNGGLESLDALFKEYADKLPEAGTPVVRTGGGGLHFYFSTEKELRNRTGVRPGIDIRGDGGYVVAPPSPHASGTAYVWEDDSGTLAPWPFDLHNEAAGPISETFIEGKVREGKRHDYLTAQIGSMRRRDMSRLAARQAALAENQERCDPPWTDKEVLALVDDIYRRYNPAEPSTSIELETMAVSAKQFLEQVVENPDWLIERLWTSSSIGFIVGPPKVYKSFLALEMAAAVASGKDFLGQFKVPVARTVLLIQEESGKAAFKKRVANVTKVYGGEENLFVISNRPFNLEDKLGYERLKMEVSRVRPALLILDPLSSFVRGNQNDAQNMGSFVRSLMDLRNEFDMAICIVHHSKKADPKQFRGSSALYASSEVTIRVYRFDDGVHRSKLTFELKDDESPESFDVQYQQSTGVLVGITQTQLLAMAMSAQAHRNEEPHYNK